MKRKNSMLRAIVLRFAAYSLGIEFAVSILEEILSAVVPEIGNIILYDRFPNMSAGLDPGIVFSLVLWGLAQLLVYGAGIFLFARGVNRMLQEQIRLREEERMRLFSNIAHDLKTPMTTIMGYAGALADGMVEEPGRRREYHLAVKAKSEQMNGLIDRLLSYSKLGASHYKMNFSRVDLAELLRAACASLFGEMENKQMELRLSLPDEPLFCDADALELDRAVGNLLSNAIRHNPDGTLLSVGLAADNEHIAIQIADSGAAIPDTAARNIFEPFVSGSDARSTGSGTGLGLAIVKKAAELHGGGVFLSDAPAPYTKMFVLRLPKNRKPGGLYVR